MRLSIVTISFNQGRFLRQCMESVLSQSHPEIEYIVVDPGSRDDSRQIIESYGRRVTAVLEPDDGPADGLNKGFARASGDWFGFLNADDLLLPGALERIAGHVAQRPEVDVWSAGGYVIDESGRRQRTVLPSRFTPWLYAHGGVSVFQQGTFFRADAFRHVGGFNAANSTCWDGELFLDMALAGARFATVGDRLAEFRLHQAGISGSGRLIERYRDDNQRLFVKAMGRPRQRLDVIGDLTARLAKFLLDPRYTWHRLSMGKPPAS